MCNQKFPRALFFLLGVAALALIPFSWATTYKVLHAFTGGADGGGLYGSVVRDASGYLYGVTSGGGSYERGTVFQLAPQPDGKWIETVLYNFCPDLPRCIDGALPTNGLALDGNGNLYGPTSSGGPQGLGSVFQLAPGDEVWIFTLLADIGSPPVIVDSKGKVYGEIGPGKCNGGEILKLIPPADGSDWTSKVLYSFCLHNNEWSKGKSPNYGLAWDSMGNLYGITDDGGAYSFGVVFQLERTPNGWKEHVLHNFRGGRDGFFPQAGVVVDSTGSVYGSTMEGGSDRCGGTGCGTIFMLVKQPDGHWKETILYRFRNLYDGAGPVGTLALDGAGSLYGVAGGGTGPCGGGGCGVVFRLSPNPDGTWSYTVLHRFTGPDGAGPLGGLILDPKGHLFGTTSYGGSGGYGVVFKIAP